MKHLMAFGLFALVCLLPTSAVVLSARGPAPQAVLPHGIPHLCASDPAATVVAAGATYTLQGAETCVRVEGTLVIPARLSIVTTILAYPSSTVNCVDGADVAFRDVPINTTVDPEQLGNGFVAVDATVRCRGQAKTPFVRLGAEPLAGATTLTLSAPVTGWLAGDRLALPDTRHVNDLNWFNPSYALQHEICTVASVSGLTVTCTTPLAFSHQGGRNFDGTIFRLPHVANLTRSIVLRSENPAGARGHFACVGRADCDIQNVSIQDMGRTTTLPLDSTTFASGSVSHVGTNQIGRYAAHFHHLIGPVNPTNTGYQGVFSGNVVERSSKWGFAIHNSHYLRVQGNVVYDGTGAGIVTEDGSESFNLIDGNFVFNIKGGNVSPRNTGPSAANGRQPGAANDCYWFAGWNNTITNNVAAGCRNVSQAVASGAGIKFASDNIGGPVKQPKIRGTDFSNPAEYVSIRPRLQPLLQLQNLEVYGVTAVGLTWWYLGTDGYSIPSTFPESVVADLTCWNTYGSCVWLYPVSDLTLLRMRYRSGLVGDGASASTPTIQSGDYRLVRLKVIDSDVQAGSLLSWYNTDLIGTALFQNNTVVARQPAYIFRTPSTPGTGAVRPATGVTITIRGGTVKAWPGYALKTIAMEHTLAYANSDTANPYRVKVENYQGTGSAFDVFFPIQLNANLYGGFSTCGDTTTRPEIAGITCGSVAPPPPTPVDCVVSAWSAWSAFSAWTPNGDGTEGRTQTRTRTVITPASNGGVACVGPYVETNTETRVIPPPANPCLVTPLVIPVTRWPAHQTGDATAGTWIPGSFTLVKAGFEWLPTLRFLATDVRGCQFLKVK